MNSSQSAISASPDRRQHGRWAALYQPPASSRQKRAFFGNTVLVPAVGPKTSSSGRGGNPQLVAYTVL
jgi:hypothetical protein